MMQWLRRTTDLKLCPDCLTPSVEGDKDCRHCMQRYIQWSPYYTQQNSRETQTEVNDCIDQEKQEEVQNTKTIVENQKQQIKDLEDRLQQQVSTNECLNAQLQDTSYEKEQVLQQLKEAKLKIGSIETQLVNASATMEKTKS